MKQFQAILFDLDGTLVDSIPDLISASQAVLDDHGYAPLPENDIKAMVGKGVAVLVQRFWQQASSEDLSLDSSKLKDLVVEFDRYYQDFNGQKTYFYPSVPEVLTQLKQQGYQLGVVTNKPAKFTEPLLEKLSLNDFFTVIVSGDTCEKRKPDAMQLDYAAQQLGVSKDHVLMVGDSNNDLGAAQSAGVPCILLTYGYSEGLDVRTLDAWQFADHFSDILKILEN